MTGRENKQVKILIVLVVVLALIFLLGPGLNRPPTASVEARPTPEAGQAAAPAAVNDARIRLDLIDQDGVEREAGRENLFQYRNAQTAAGTRPAKSRPEVSNPFAQPPTPAAAPPPAPARPAPPPGPPPITLRYQGFARDDVGRTITAFLVDSPTAQGSEFSPHYNVKTGDVLVGRYRIAAVTDTFVEVEDLQYKRNQTLPLLK